MHEVAALIAGVRGAENGTAQLFRRGTSTRATWYADFEGNGANSTGADINLDSYGGAVVFVGELVDVVVKASSANGGATVRRFCAGARDDAVEVQSPSFTGVDYETGASGTNLPTTLGSVLDRWATSAGTSDFNVLQGGVSVTLQQAVSGNIFINVKQAPYNAVGDGTTDDTSAINSAILAADALGGVTVYFPPGTYKTTAALAVKSPVRLFGAAGSAIKRNTSSFTLLDFENVAATEYFVSGIRFEDATTGTSQPMFTLPVACIARFELCVFDETGGAGSTSPMFNDVSGTIRLSRTTVLLRGGAESRLVNKTGGGLAVGIFLDYCTFFWLGAVNFSQYGMVGIVQANSCMFSVLASAGVTVPGIMNLTAPSSVGGNLFTTSQVAPDSIVAIQATGTTENECVEYGNSFDDIYVFAGGASGRLLANSLDLRTVSYTIAAPGTQNINGNFGRVLVRTTGIAGTYVIAMDNTSTTTPLTCDIVLRNTSANNHLVDFTGTSPADVGVAVNAGLVLRARYVKSIDAAGTEAWFRQTAFTVTAI